MDRSAPTDVTVTVLRGSCADDETCFKITDTGDPEYLHFIGEPETDTAILAAHGRHIGPGEVLYRFPRRHLPEVTA
jgi:hypothetical protein